jgi:hypothetical protein
MRLWRNLSTMRSGRVPLVLLWLLGVPIPILLLMWLFRGCS